MGAARLQAELGEGVVGMLGVVVFDAADARGRSCKSVGKTLVSNQYQPNKQRLQAINQATKTCDLVGIDFPSRDDQTMFVGGGGLLLRTFL